MSKPIIVVTHERSGTHLTINTVNYENKGKFTTIGYLPKISKEKPFTTNDYINKVYKDIHVYAYIENIVCKSHHQSEFFKDYEDFLFSNYKVIHIYRDVKDVLVSYYKFLFGDIKNKPLFEDWIFMKPQEVGEKYLVSSGNHMSGPDPHILIEPENYIDRWKRHKDGWLKYNEPLHLTYEEFLTDFKLTKEKLENFLGREVNNFIPDINNKELPNFAPNKGIIGSHVEYMDKELIKKINEYL